MQGVLDDFLERTVDLAQLDSQALAVLSDESHMDAFRYLAAPPISVDDLKTLVETNSLASQRLERDPELVARLVSTIRSALDRRRFPWVPEGREPTDDERNAAVIATAALMATQRVETDRRTVEKRRQEEQIQQALTDRGFTAVNLATGTIATMRDAPKPGEFTREIVLGDRRPISSSASGTDG